MLHEADRDVEAEAACRRALELVPQKAGAHSVISVTLLAQDRSEEALAEAVGEPDEASRLWALAIVQHALRNRAGSNETLQQMIDKHTDDAAYQIAEVCATRGEADAAFAWLERAHAQRDGGLSGMKRSRELRSLHSDPRWRVFLKKMGFEE